MAATTASIFTYSTQPLFMGRSVSCSSAGPSVSNSQATNFMGASLPGYVPVKRDVRKTSRQVYAAAVAATPLEEIKEFSLPRWAEFDLGKAPVYWKTMNGLPPMAGEKLKLFYNPTATKIVPNEDFGIAFNGGFNQPIMCGGEPRAMLRKNRGKADPPIYTIQICIPKHAVNLIFSFTNGVEWDGPYRLQFQVPKAWRNKPITFFNEGLAEELGKEGACEKAIFPDTDIVITRCAIMGNLTAEGEIIRVYKESSAITNVLVTTKGVGLFGNPPIMKEDSCFIYARQVIVAILISLLVAWIQLRLRIIRLPM